MMPRSLVATVLCFSLPAATLGAESHVGYPVIYSGGSLPNVRGGEDLKLYLDLNRVRLRHKSADVMVIPTKAITEISYGQEVHHRIGTAAGLAIISFGIGALVAFSKSKKHYIGITWANAQSKGGIVLQADKNEYRGLLTALEGVSGMAAVDTDSPRQATQPTNPTKAQAQDLPAEAQATIAQSQVGILIRFTSTPTNAEVQIDGEYWGSTPTSDLTRLAAGPHTILLKKPGYQAWERKITLTGGDDRTINGELEPDTDMSKPRISGQF